MAHPVTPRTQAWLGHAQRVALWILVPVMAALTLFDLRRDVNGNHGVLSLELLLYTVIVVVTLPVIWVRRRHVLPASRRVLGSFGTVWACALVSSLTTTRPLLQKVVVERRYLVTPVIEAGLVPVAAFGIVLSMAPKDRRRALWMAAVTIVALTPFAWWRGVANGEIIRLSSALGGAAVVHVPLLLCAGIFADHAVRGSRVVLNATLAVAAVVMALLSGSRAGLICVALFTLLVLRWGTSGRARRLTSRVAVATGLALGLLVVVVPSLRRLVAFSDELRLTNLTTAMDSLGGSPSTVFFGLGWGRLWPWFAFETGRLQMPWRGEGPTEFGTALTNPHSIFLGVLVELGALALIPVVLMFVFLVLAVARRARRGDSPGLLVCLAVIATLPAFLFDLYLFKNFATSFWWWLVLAAFLATGPAGDERSSVADPGAAALPE
ncbi:hypothetical protein [Luteococcus sp. OSA5]|uniref:O-antigen ligase family protein n=1 Tax=Luteococcus sp. OSA5 TaxID=3401630 RepID=UPI003B43B837